MNIGYKAWLDPFETLIRQSEDTPHDIILLSSEAFIRTVLDTSEHFEDYCQFWESRGYGVELLTVVRAFEETIESQYCQGVKTLNRRVRFEPWARRGRRELPAAFRIWSTRPLGRRPITYLPYNTAMRADVVTAIFKALELEDRAPEVQRGGGQINTRPDWRRVEICLRLARARAMRAGPVPPGVTKWDWGRLGPMLNYVRDATRQLGWDNQPFHALTDDLRLDLLENREKVAEALAMKEWGQSWEDVFGPRSPLPPVNEFNPDHVDSADIEEIQRIVRGALAVEPVRSEKSLQTRPARWPLGPGHSST